MSPAIPGLSSVPGVPPTMPHSTFTNRTAAFHLLSAIVDRTRDVLKKCEQTPAWQTWIFDAEMRQYLDTGFIVWAPSRWIDDLSKSQLNIASTMIRDLAEDCLVELLWGLGNRIHAVKLTPAGEKALRQLKRKAGLLKAESREATPVS